jgi:hypothetical protein
MADHFTVFGFKWDMNSHHLAFSRLVVFSPAALDNGVINDVWDAMESDFTAHRTWCSSATALTKLSEQEVAFVSAPGGFRFHPTTVENTRDENISGGGSASMSSPQVTYRVTTKTTLPGRSYRGRIYLPSPPEGEVDANGVLSSGARSSAQDFMDALLTDVNAALSGASAALVVPSFKHGTVQVMNDALVRDRVGTQRRRLKATAVA